MAAVTAMHEQMHADADQQREQKGEYTENVRTMLNPEKHARNGEKNAERESRWGVQEWSPPIFTQLWINRTVIVMSHDL